MNAPRVVMTVLLALGGIAAAQTEQGRLLLATVVDARARAIVDLGVDDFVVTEGAAVRDVLDVHVADYPVVVLLDDGADQAAGEAIRSSARRFIQRIGERPVMIGVFSDAAAMRVPFEDDRALLLDKLSRLTLYGAARAPLLEVIAKAAAEIRATETPFAAIVILSATPPGAADAENSERLPFVVDTQAPVHVVALNATATSSVDLLRGLSEQTRGQYTQVFSTASYGIALDRLADRLSAEMIVGYLVPANASGGDVQVGVKRPGARVLGLGVSR